MTNYNRQQDRYQDLDDAVWNILLDSEDLDVFPALFTDGGEILQEAFDGAKQVTLQEAVDMFGAETVADCVQLNLMNNELNRLLDEMAEIIQ